MALETMDFSVEMQNMGEEQVILGSLEMASMTVECLKDVRKIMGKVIAKNLDSLFTPNASLAFTPSVAASAGPLPLTAMHLE